MIEDEVLSREQSLDHAHCGTWNTHFSEMDVMRKFNKKHAVTLRNTTVLTSRAVLECDANSSVV